MEDIADATVIVTVQWLAANVAILHAARACGNAADVEQQSINVNITTNNKT